MDTTVIILSGILISLISGIVGKMIGANGAVKYSRCEERQLACRTLLLEKIENLTITVNRLEKTINSFKY